ncbi:hypothetical protein K431DRAFT_238701 [Polychaeton citri CBS 116435]|uniref:Uncharacterized protein n=1 Tax=Polychaeton citri CBS 116435 TaxID=1314669 RepID=A0A9P4USY7_9PEZI|nr:hypothetical protein K431DRAFT_238701 [Polychaeton citri CBS 116435]
MTSMHQKQTIEDDVKKQVLRWDETRGIDVKLTCGYGPPLVWRLFEFKPKTDELLGQLQYLRDENGFVKMHKKWSLPLGIVKLNTGQDDAHFENFLQSALSREHLWEFGWTCFEEETEMDDFQARLLQLMCDLYMATDDPNLQPHLEATLRMMLITYIMGHTITITEETSSDVLSSIQYRDKPAYLPPHTSPRLANRQLKFFFAILRAKIYDKILNWQQQTLHTGRDKAGSWLGSFCATLGFAMVLEEVQRTIQIQAHAKVEKGEMGRDEAMTEAMNACKRIDDGFEFLVKLFRCKYRTRKWTTAGSFGIQTPTLSRPEQVEFCQQTRQLLEEKVEHLRSRENVTFAPENQCLYTSRLVARFLLKFLMTSDGP